MHEIIVPYTRYVDIFPQLAEAIKGDGPTLGRRSGCCDRLPLKGKRHESRCRATQQHPNTEDRRTSKPHTVFNFSLHQFFNSPY